MCYKYTHSLRWPSYVFNLAVNTKLPATHSHRSSSTVSLVTYPLYSFVNIHGLFGAHRNLSPAFPNRRHIELDKDCLLIKGYLLRSAGKRYIVRVMVSKRTMKQNKFKSGKSNSPVQEKYGGKVVPRKI